MQRLTLYLGSARTWAGIMILIKRNELHIGIHCPLFLYCQCNQQLQTPHNTQITRYFRLYHRTMTKINTFSLKLFLSIYFITKMRKIKYQNLEMFLFQFLIAILTFQVLNCGLRSILSFFVCKVKDVIVI